VRADAILLLVSPIKVVVQDVGHHVTSGGSGSGIQCVTSAHHSQLPLHVLAFKHTSAVSTPKRGFPRLAVARSLVSIRSLRPLQQATQGSGLLRPQVSGMNVASLLCLHRHPIGLPFDSLPLLGGEPQPFDLVTRLCEQHGCRTLFEVRTQSPQILVYSHGHR
jgi:hypothetical protein